MRPTNPFVEFAREDTEQSLSNRFEEQARKYPHRLAVGTKHQRLTYDALNRLSNRAAHAMGARCRDFSQPVVLLFQQGVPLITASIGALKAGKAYVPLDFSLPYAKARQILENVQPDLIVTDTGCFSLAEKLARGRLKILNLDNTDPTVPGENPGLSISPDQVAYINYTSGSTGEPKGVVWNHRSELFGIKVKTNALHIAPDDRVSLVRSNNVGAARDMFLALLNGAALLPFDLRENSLADLGDWLIRANITVFTCVATIFRHAVQSLAGNKKIPEVRLVHIGGEPVFKSDVDLYKKHFSDRCILVNRYSISETQAVSYHFINKQTEIKGERVPVGLPLEGNEVLLLDEEGKAVGTNRIGEIAVRSPYLALGYWRQPELTKAKFLPGPRGENSRIYLTGDLGYRLPDGCLVHTGRKDFQVKIRGHRVEVLEVEMALLDVQGVRQAVVVPRRDPGGAQRLVAYVVFHAGQALTTSQLRRAMKAKLPHYMLPASIIMLDTLPLTASGKVDRRALPSPEEMRPALDKPLTKPRTLFERAVAKIWSDVLRLDTVGIHDNVFDLGGDSLIASSLIAKIRKKFRLPFSLQDFFAAPTVAGVAERIEKSDPNDRTRKVTSCVAPRCNESFPVSFAQEQLWHLSQLLPEADFFNLTSAYWIKGPLNLGILKKSLKELVKRHPSLRTVFSSVKEQPFQFVGEIFDIDMSVVDLRRLSPGRRRKEIARLGKAEARRPFDLAKGPLLRTRLYRVSKGKYLLLVTMHHIISDRWSIEVFWNELAVIYEAMSRGREPVLPKIHFQFVDFVRWQQSALDTDFMKVRLDYWQKQLAPPLTRLVFRRRYGRKGAMSFRTAQLPLALEPNVFSALKSFSCEEHSTPFIVLLTVLNIMLYWCTGQNDIRIGTLVANRDHAETERVIGHFINTVVLRSRPHRRFTLREFLTEVGETTVAAQVHQHLPFEHLLRFLERKGKISRSSLFQVMFVYHNANPEALESTRLIFRPADNFLYRAESRLTLTTCDLIMLLKETENRLVGSLTFKRGTFGLKDVNELRRGFFGILKCVMKSPESTIGRVCDEVGAWNH